MNLVLDHYSDNPVIATLVSWPPHPHGVDQIRVCSPLLRKPFIEITYRNGQTSHHAFGKQGFQRFWQEAELILARLTDIRLIKEFDFEPMQDERSFLEEISHCVEESILESNAIFEGGMYQLFLDQYGPNCRDLPDEVSAKILEAKQHIEN